MSKNYSQGRVYLIFISIILAIILFLVVIFYRAIFDRNLPKLQSSDFDSALRGSIITKDGFSVANSQKLYKAMLDTRSIDPNKKELFIKLYTLYSGNDPKKIRKILNKKGVVTLSYEIDAKGAAYLKELSRKLYRKKVFIPYEDPKTGLVTTQGMSIIESGEKRIYMAEDTLTPVIGYIKKVEKNSITKVDGVKGIEKVYDNFLSSTQDAIIKGPRDLSNIIILSGDSNWANRIDGYNVFLNIPLKLQKVLEKMATKMAQELLAKEIVVGVMQSKTGQIISLVSTSRYNPSNITKSNYEALNSTASEYAYEVGSIMKPVIFSMLLEHGKVNPLETINTYGGKYKLGQRIITDSHKNDFLSAEDVIVESSNIGMIQLIDRLSEAEIYNGLLNFGFSKKTGVDLSYEQAGTIPSISELRNKTYKATLSYGYGLQATFMQMLNIYNAINNNGIMITPKITNKLEKNGKFYSISEPEKRAVLSIDTAKTIKRILIKVVQSPKGTAKKAKIDGLTIGGKTGTAHIATKGGYSDKRYNASFFGFANDAYGNNYTIGVLVREPMRPYPYYFAAWSALPVFKHTVELLIDNNYLIPSQDTNTTKTNDNANFILD